MSLEAVKSALDKTLIDGLRPELKDTIDRLIARGMSKRAVLEIVRVTIARATRGSMDVDRGKLTYAAIEAYLAGKPVAGE